MAGHRIGWTTAVVMVTAGLAGARLAGAQTLGSFRWQLQPYCNVLTVTVVQDGGQYHLDGTDDQCGAARKASVVGLGFPNPDGTIGFGLTIVTTPGGAPVHVDARIGLATISGPWSDSAGDSGTLAFTPGAGTGGSPRPMPNTTIPSTIRLLPDGGVLAGGAPNNGSIPASGLGTRMMWYPAKAAFRAGQVTIPAWDDVNVGRRSAAFGLNTVAAGDTSAAFGEETVAGGIRSATFGRLTQATGENSFAAGNNSAASAINSVAFGNSTVASGPSSMAIGQNTRAFGAYSFAAGANAIARASSSVAIGNAEVLAAATGSFAFGDFSSLQPIVADLTGQFKVRASNGVRFATNAAETTGVQMVGNGSQWLQLSDVASKHRFRDLDTDDVLARIAAMPVTEWSYTAQEAAVRHIGPTAQDFFAAFGLGEDRRYIGTLDGTGVALAGVKALDARTHGLPTRAAALEAENAALRGELLTLRERLDRLEHLLSTSAKPAVAVRGGR